MITMNSLKKSYLSVCLCSITLSLVGCQSVPDAPKQAEQTLDSAIAENQAKKAPKPLTAIPNSVQQELANQSLQQAKNTLLQEPRLDVSANDVDAQSFFAGLVEGSSYSVVVRPDVSGTITLNLKDVTLNEVFDVIRDVYGYDIRQQGSVVQVYPAGMRTETIALDYLFIKRLGQSNTSVNSGGVAQNDPNSGSGNNSNQNSNNLNSGNNSSNNQNGSGNDNSNSNSGVNIQTSNQSDFWQELTKNLRMLIGLSTNAEGQVAENSDGRSVIVSPQAGLVTVRAKPSDIEAVRQFLADSQKHLRRQVIIEAKILEVTLNDDYQQGIRWDQVIGHVGNTNINFSTTGQLAGNVISTTIGGTSSLGITNKNFSTVLNLLQTQGNVQVLSSPRITATNNQKAVIKVGQDEYFVTRISSTTTTGTTTTTTPQIELTPFFSGIALDVTPQIDKNGQVILHVHPSVTLTKEQVKEIRFNDSNVVLPLAQSNVRESDTVVKANSGEIVVIGGLIETRKEDTESKTPLLGDIPVVGELFKSKGKSTSKRELVIMLKPIVVGQDTWRDQLQDARDLLKQWFPESQ